MLNTFSSIDLELAPASTALTLLFRRLNGICRTCVRSRVFTDLARLICGPPQSSDSARDGWRSRRAWCPNRRSAPAPASGSRTHWRAESGTAVKVELWKRHGWLSTSHPWQHEIRRETLVPLCNSVVGLPRLAFVPRSPPSPMEGRCARRMSNRVRGRRVVRL